MIWDFKKFNNRIAITEANGLSITYEDLFQTGEEIYSVIDERCLLFSYCSNTIGSIAGYVSFINHRVVPLLLNCNMDKELSDSLIELYRPSFIWMPKEKREMFSDKYENVYQKAGYVLLKTYLEPYELFDDLALLLTTSGSTGSPKLVRQTYRNILSNALSIVQYLELDETERPITTLPMNYTYGLSIINSHLLVGAEILATEDSLTNRNFWEFFKMREATSFGGVPFTYEMLNKIRFFKMNLPSLRTMTQAGGKITKDLHLKFAQYAYQEKKKFIVMYGQCEATARMAYLPAEKAMEKIGSMGIVIPGGKLRIVDVNGETITKPRVPGELLYEGENVTLGYAEKGEDLKTGDERHGILHTGDVAEFDEDGFFYVVGRLKRFLKVYGNRVNLDELERLIKSKFENIVCAVTGTDDHIWVFTQDNTWGESIIRYLSHTTHLNIAAFKIKVIEEIPHNDAGKVLYKELDKIISDLSKIETIQFQ